MNNNTIEQLNNTYINLMQQAEAAVSRKDAVRLIHIADKIRMKMSNPPSYSLWQDHNNHTHHMYYKILSALALGVFMTMMSSVTGQADSFNKCVKEVIEQDRRYETTYEAVRYCNGVIG